MNITLDKVNYIYNPGTVNEKAAVRDVSLEIHGGEFLALIGSTGSGKSTLIQLFNALKLPTSGTILYNGEAIGNDKEKQRQIRCKVGLVFQYPEYQLFAETIIKDVSFGPSNIGLGQAEAQERAVRALKQVGIREEYFQKSPFDLSGGEKRRVAIAGVLAMEPEILILDEPTAGLDPEGKRQILDLVAQYQKENQTCVIMVSHNMDEVAEYAQRVLVMQDGNLIIDGAVREVFARKEELEAAGLSVPQVNAFARELGIDDAITLRDAAQKIYEKFR